MISTESLSQEWLETVSKELGYPDKGLLEKAIRALSLLELLVKAGCPLCFKGGSSLLLLLRNTIHRVSIDVDIICPPGTDINLYLEGIRDYGFTRAVPTGREHPGGTVPVSHSKVFYEIAYNPMLSEAEGYIRLDVLYEDIQYSRVEMVPIEHPVLKTKGEPVMVKVPTKEDILGDKLTAFGPNSIGIPYEFPLVTYFRVVEDNQFSRISSLSPHKYRHSDENIPDKLSLSQIITTHNDKN
ncbi:MAG: nucleotidyl transferase AbiEii/AbiGii toxin family protein [Candidatus Cryptobacteroides sp.]